MVGERKGSKACTDFAFVTSDPKMLPDPQEMFCKKGKKENKGKRGRGSCCRTQLRHVRMQRGLGSPWFTALSLSRLDIAGSAQL